MPKATAVFDADDSRLGAALARINSRMLALQSRIAKCAGASIALRSVAHVVGAGFDRFRQALDLGGKLSDLSANTGVAMGDLVLLQQEFANAGKSAEDLGPALAKMAKTLHGRSAADVVAKLGLSLDELKQKTPAEQFRELGRAIDSVRDPSQRAAVSMELFGRSGAELLALFSSGGFGDAAQQVGSQAELLARDAALFDDVSDKLALTGVKVRGFWVGLADKVAPVLKPLLDRFFTIDFASWGQRIGDAVAFIVQAFADGKVGEIIFASLKIAFASAVNFLAGTLMAVAQALWQALVEAVKNAVTLFEIVTTAEFWVGMGKALIGIAQNFIAFLLEGVARLLDTLKNVPLVGERIGDGAQSIRDTAQGIRESGRGDLGASADRFAPAFDKVTGRMQEAFSNIGQALNDGFDQGSSLIDMSGLEQELDDAVGSVMERVQIVSQQSHEAVEPKQGSGSLLDLEDGQSSKPSVAAIQRIGGGGAAYGAGDPMLREQQRQTKELATQTGLLRDVKRLLDRSPSPKATLTPVFGSHMSEPLRTTGITGGISETGVASVDVPVYVETLVEALTVLPNLGIGLPYRSRTFAQEDDGSFKVILHFEGISDDAPHSDDEKVTFELDTSMAEDPIQTHPFFDKLKTRYGWDANKEQFAETWPESDGGQQLALGGASDSSKTKMNPMFGVESWLVVGAIFRKTYAARIIPASILRGIGTIVGKPPGIEQFRIPSAAKKRNWLKLAPKIRRRGNAVEITEEYMLSGPNGWLADMYGEGQLERASE